MRFGFWCWICDQAPFPDSSEADWHRFEQGAAVQNSCDSVDVVDKPAFSRRAQKLVRNLARADFLFN